MCHGSDQIVSLITQAISVSAQECNHLHGFFQAEIGGGWRREGWGADQCENKEILLSKPTLPQLFICTLSSTCSCTPKGCRLQGRAMLAFAMQHLLVLACINLPFGCI